MYKMVAEITKETWGKCGITTVKHYNEKRNIIELWHKKSDVERQIAHSNITDVALKRIRKYYVKKQKTLQKKNKNTNHFLKVKRVFLLLKSLHVLKLSVLNYQKP